MLGRRLPRLHLRLAGREWPAFRVCGLVGLAGASALATTLSVMTGISVGVQALIIALAVLTFLALSLATKVLSGREALIYYHHEVAVLAVTAAATAALGAPVLAHLDATALGLGVFLACGRVGCLLVGCCHGRPARRHGVIYGRGHVEEGFPAHLAGVALVPVQAIEAAVVGVLVAAGAAAVVLGAPPGTGLAVYVGGYAVARFGLELLRGDECRHSALGLSEAQWTSIALLVGMSGTGHSGGMLALCAVAALVPLALRQAHRPGGQVRRPAHVRELAETLDGSAPAAVVATSAGLRVSWGEDAGARHYTLSGGGPGAAAAAAEVVRRLRHPAARAELVAGHGDITHLVVLP